METRCPGHSERWADRRQSPLQRPFLLRNLFGQCCPLGEGIWLGLVSSLPTGALQISPLLKDAKYSLALKIIATKKKKKKRKEQPLCQESCYLTCRIAGILRQPGDELLLIVMVMGRSDMGTDNCLKDTKLGDDRAESPSQDCPIPSTACSQVPVIDLPLPPLSLLHPCSPDPSPLVL